MIKIVYCVVLIIGLSACASNPATYNDPISGPSVNPVPDWVYAIPKLPEKRP